MILIDLYPLLKRKNNCNFLFIKNIVYIVHFQLFIYLTLFTSTIVVSSSILRPHFNLNVAHFCFLIALIQQAQKVFTRLMTLVVVTVKLQILLNLNFEIDSNSKVNHIQTRKKFSKNKDTVNKKCVYENSFQNYLSSHYSITSNRSY